MASDNAELIRLIEAELDVIEGGGYNQPAGAGGEEKLVFNRSLVCINHWLVPGHETDCCDDCMLLKAVPEKHRSEKTPCHFIPLNDKGETVRSLEAQGDHDRLVEAVKDWLRATLQRLKEGESPLGSEEVKY
jgi:hypothetical protein